MIIKKMMYIILIIMPITMLFACSNSEENISISQYEIKAYVTKGDQSLLLDEETSFITDENQEDLVNRITIDTNETFQVMDGFGAAMTESSAYVIASLPEDERQTLLIDLFSKTEGIGIDFIRIPMGASDFSFDNYSYNDIPMNETDLTLSNFSLERDERYIIPILKEALSINPEIKLMGSPWSAPAWMKDSKSMNGGSLLPQYYDPYANYFLKFIEGYESHGLPIYAVTPQNEPLHQTSNYPSMFMSVQQQSAFIEFLGPALRDAGHDTLIIAYDHNWDQYMYPMAVLNNETISDYVAGSAFHCYGGNVSNQRFLNESHADKGIWFTECSGGSWATNFASNMTWNMENVFIGSINYHSKGTLLWNLALNEDHGPQNGGCSNCRGVVTINNDHSITKNEEYYSIAHFSKFIIPGAQRVFVESNHPDVITTGFLNPDGSIVVVLHNENFRNLTTNLEIDGILGAYTIPSNSTVSLIIHPYIANT